MIARVVFASVLTTALLVDVAGQQVRPTPQPTFQARADLVQVDAVVVDADGRPVPGLQKSDFILLDRDVPQVIDAFEEVSHETVAEPVFPSSLKMDVADNSSARSTRLVVIGLDDLHVQGKTDAIKEMARRVVERIGPEASLALVTTSGTFGVEPTEDRSLLLRELDRFIDTFDPEGRRLANGRLAPHGSNTPFRQGNTPLQRTGVELSIPRDLGEFFGHMVPYKTIEEVSKKIGTDDSRRKAMIWISGGIPGPSAEQCKETVGGAANYSCMGAARVKNQLHRSNVVAYAIDTGDFPSRAYEEMTAASGGFTIDMQNFDRDLDRLISDLDHYYLLGFYPINPDGRGERALDVRVNRPGVTIRARRGYQPGAAPKPPKNKDPLAKLSAEVLPKTDLPLRLSAAPIPGGRGNKADVILTLEVRSDDGPRLAPGTSAPEVLKYSVWAVDLKKKKPVAHVGREARVTFAPAEVEDDRAREVRYQVHTRLSLPPGRYQFRASASSSQLGRSGSVYFDADVPDFAAEPAQVSGVMIGHSTGPRIFSMESPLIKGLVPFEPTLDREFTITDSLRVFARVGSAGAKTCTPVVSIARPEGVAVRSFDVELKAGIIDTTLALTDLLPGSYVLRVGCGAIVDALTREVGFVVRSSPVLKFPSS